MLEMNKKSKQMSAILWWKVKPQGWKNICNLYCNNIKKKSSLSLDEVERDCWTPIKSTVQKACVVNCYLERCGHF